MGKRVKGEYRVMTKKTGIEINAAIFPYVIRLVIGEPIAKELASENSSNVKFDLEMPEIIIDLPRGAYLLYLQKVVSEHNKLETRLLEQYAYGIPFSDTDYDELLKIIMTPINRNWCQETQGELLAPYGVQISSNDEGKQRIELIEDAIATIRVETWECIIIDILKKSAFEIIDCFDFSSTFVRKAGNSSNRPELKISLGAWKFSVDDAEQSLSNALRSAFMFTLVGYYYGDIKNQYQNFADYFEAEFYKRVSLIYGIWNTRGTKENIEYIPLYESFHNLNGVNKTELVQILKAILDNENIALDEKQTLRNQLIQGAGVFHQDIDSADVALEQNLIKPAVNFIMQREKAKEEIETVELLCQQGKYIACANRCYYAMLYSLKALLEYKGLLADWKENELKEAETHSLLEKKLDDLVTQGILDLTDKIAFSYVKEQRWKCDYSLYIFNEVDAVSCINKVKDFYAKVETLTI